MSTPDYRNYMCFGCSPTQPQNTDEVTKTIKICKSTAEKIWSGSDNEGNNLAVPQNFYDVYGLRSKKNEILIQSLDLPTSNDFFMNVLPPFFEDYKI